MPRHRTRLGPLPQVAPAISSARTIQAQHNSLGFRDIEFARDGRPVMLFLGDFFVGASMPKPANASPTCCEAAFPAIARSMPASADYGTDQEYLWLKRIWPTVQPSVVVLIFCAANDRLDNASNFATRAR